LTEINIVFNRTTNGHHAQKDDSTQTEPTKKEENNTKTESDKTIKPKAIENISKEKVEVKLEKKEHSEKKSETSSNENKSKSAVVKIDSSN
jgi:hypothetical protein